MLSEVSALTDLLVPSLDPPAERWTQMGTPIVTCESVAVGISTSRTEPLFPGNPGCGERLVVDLVAAISRECAFESDEQGYTVPENVEAVSAKMDSDAEDLRIWAESLDRPQGSQLAFTYLVEGGLALTTVAVAVYV